jgi:hypothetical protein
MISPCCLCVRVLYKASDDPVPFHKTHFLRNVLTCQITVRYYIVAMISNMLPSSIFKNIRIKYTEL